MTLPQPSSGSQVASPSNPAEPLMVEDPPAYPFQDVSMDIYAHAGNHYLVYADRLSGYPTVDACSNRDMKTGDVITILRRNFALFGTPARIRSDGGLQFASAEFRDFAYKWGFTHSMSSPHYPKSNGHAQAAVKAMKSLLKKSSPSRHINSNAFQRGLIEWRNTLSSHGQFPAQILLGRQLRFDIPALDSTFTPPWKPSTSKRIETRREEGRDAKRRYDTTTRQLKPIPVNSSVGVQNHLTKLWDLRGHVVAVSRNRDYCVKMSSGRKLWRNRRFIKLDTAIDGPMFRR